MQRQYEVLHCRLSLGVSIGTPVVGGEWVDNREAWCVSQVEVVQGGSGRADLTSGARCNEPKTLKSMPISLSYEQINSSEFVLLTSSPPVRIENNCLVVRGANLMPVAQCFMNSISLIDDVNYRSGRYRCQAHHVPSPGTRIKARSVEWLPIMPQ